jgi:hypothetical protein
LTDNRPSGIKDVLSALLRAILRQGGGRHDDAYL